MGLLVKVVVVVDGNMYYKTIEPKKFEPKVEYLIINSKVGVNVVAYSDKTKTELHSFIEQNRKVGFTVKEIDGTISGVLDPDFLKGSTIVYNEIQ